jgi:hypothetical protein
MVKIKNAGIYQHFVTENNFIDGGKAAGFRSVPASTKNFVQHFCLRGSSWIFLTTDKWGYCRAFLNQNCILRIWFLLITVNDSSLGLVINKR